MQIKIEGKIPSMFQYLGDILLNHIASDMFKEHSLAFRCRRCEDVIDIRLRDITAIVFHEDFFVLRFDEDSIWLSNYKQIDDVWIEKLIYVDEYQQTLMDDF